MIEMREVNKTYLMGGQPLQALKDLDLNVGPGEYLSVMGPSGSGKSTLLNMIGLLDRPDSGSYRLNDEPTEALSEEARAALRRDNIGFIFQAFHLVGRLSAFENVELPMVLAGVAPAERKRAVNGVLDQVGLLSRSHHRPNQLSGGQLQRVAIARAIVMKPRILLADEPTGNLDQQSGRDIVEVLENLNQEGITLIVVTHDMAMGKRARRRGQMVDGAIVSDDLQSSGAAHAPG
ncbi:MAG: macrolide ABC transporter ATP-binding protein [Porticoccaceae bacterium]|nr:macrolide ABC transporter ATP-binding protein [Porticoccaceae bacterium]